MNELTVTVSSFGYKHGLLEDVNLLLDVRFLPNPFWVEEMRHSTGLVQDVADYVVQSREGVTFLRLVEPLVVFLIQENIVKSKKKLHLAVGCTGGRHRSVAVVERLKQVVTRFPVDLTVCHRDIERDGPVDNAL